MRSALGQGKIRFIESFTTLRRADCKNGGLKGWQREIDRPELSEGAADWDTAAFAPRAPLACNCKRNVYGSVGGIRAVINGGEQPRT